MISWEEEELKKRVEDLKEINNETELVDVMTSFVRCKKNRQDLFESMMLEEMRLERLLADAFKKGVWCLPRKF